MEIQTTDADPPAQVRPERDGVLTFALNEFFDALDVIYLEHDVMMKSPPRIHVASRGFTGFDQISGKVL
jgi:hypothetical protein